MVNPGTNPGRGAKVVFAAVAAALLLWPVSAFAAGLGGLSPKLVAVADGPAGLKWIGGERESPLMHPGMNCIACHAKGEGPKLGVAGTVFKNIDEKDDFFGVEGVTVHIVDSKGKSVDLVTNKAGNFMVSARKVDLVPPFSVKVLKGKAEREMMSPAPSGNCASCHTAAGAGGAPGRVMAP